MQSAFVYSLSYRRMPPECVSACLFVHFVQKMPSAHMSLRIRLMFAANMVMAPCMHGVKAVRLGSVISKNMLEFRILRLYLVSLSGLECKLWCFLKLHQPVLFLCPYRHAVSFDLCSVFIASLSARARLALLCVEIICPNLVTSMCRNNMSKPGYIYRLSFLAVLSLLPCVLQDRQTYLHPC